jgi:hypothetical protein
MDWPQVNAKELATQFYASIAEAEEEEEGAEPPSSSPALNDGGDSRYIGP